MAEHFTAFKSSNVKALTYEAKADELQVEFKNGARYAYEGVTSKNWHELQHAKSIGKAVNKISDKHSGRKLGA